jgi:hypothetical protein
LIGGNHFFDQFGIEAGGQMLVSIDGVSGREGCPVFIPVQRCNIEESLDLTCQYRQDGLEVARQVAEQRHRS